MPYSAAQVHKLTIEFAGDPLTRGYAGMSDLEKLASLLVEDRLNPRLTVSSGEIMEAINTDEFMALNDLTRVRVDRVLGLGAEVIVGPGNNHTAVQELLAAFGSNSDTIAALVALRDQVFSRAAELKLPAPILADILRA